MMLGKGSRPWRAVVSVGCLSILASGSEWGMPARGMTGNGSVLVSLTPASSPDNRAAPAPVTNGASARVLSRYGGAPRRVAPRVRTDPDAGRAAEKPEAKVIERRLRVTAYCDRGLTAAGIPSGVGQCAAPEDVPFGSIVYIPALKRSFVVTDRTHKRFRQTTVDLFMPDRQECLEFGLNYLDCVITFPSQPHRYGCTSIYSTIARVQGELAAAR